MRVALGLGDGNSSMHSVALQEIAQQKRYAL